MREGNEPSLLDLIFTNEENMIENLTTHPSLGKSDHLILSFNYICYTLPDFKCEQKSRLNFFKGDYVSIREELDKINWTNNLNGMDMLQSWRSFAEINIDLMEKHIPVSKTPQGCGRPKPFST